MQEEKKKDKGVMRDANGHLMKGTQKVPGSGRQAAGDKPTVKALQKALANLSIETLDDFKMNLAKLNGREFCQVWLYMQKYVLPAIQAISIMDATESHSSFADTLRQLASDNDNF
jgi:hypothetical protein